MRGTPKLLAWGLLLLTACTSPARSSSSNPSEGPAPPEPPVTMKVPYSPPNLPLVPSVHLPSGFAAYLYATDLQRPTAMAFGPDGRLYVTELLGRIVAVPSPGSRPEALLENLSNPLGLVWRNNELFVSVKASMLSYRLEGGRLTGGKAVVTGLPFGRYQNNSVILVPNGEFLVGLGGTCDACQEKDARSGTVLRFRKDWSYAGIVVRGIHNPYGLALRRSNGAAYVTINGQDNLGPDEPADHLLRVMDGLDAGWPRCWPSAQA